MSKLKQNVSVKTIMTENPDTLTLNGGFSEAAELFIEKGYHHLPVVSGGKLVGIFSHTDLLREDYSSSFGQDRREVLASLDRNKSLEHAMSTDVMTLGERETIKDAAKKFCQGNFHALPVMTIKN